MVNYDKIVYRYCEWFQKNLKVRDWKNTIRIIDDKYMELMFRWKIEKYYLKSNAEIQEFEFFVFECKAYAQPKSSKFISTKMTLMKKVIFTIKLFCNYYIKIQAFFTNWIIFNLQFFQYFFNLLNCIWSPYRFPDPFFEFLMPFRLWCGNQSMSKIRCFPSKLGREDT